MLSSVEQEYSGDAQNSDQDDGTRQSSDNNTAILPSSHLGLTSPSRSTCTCVHFLKYFLLIHTAISFPIGDFEPLYMDIKTSKYLPKVSYCNGLTQDTVLGWYFREDPDIMREMQEAIVQNPGRRVISFINPCHHGFLFTGIREGKLYMHLS